MHKTKKNRYRPIRIDHKATTKEKHIHKKSRRRTKKFN